MSARTSGNSFTSCWRTKTLPTWAPIGPGSPFPEKSRPPSPYPTLRQPSISWHTIRMPSHTSTAPRLISVCGSRLKLLPDRWARWFDAHVRGSIVTRTTLAILVPAMILGLTFASFVSGSVERSEQQRAQIRLQQLLSTVERTAQIACYLNDRTLAQEIAHGLISNRSVSRVTLTSGALTLSQVDNPESLKRNSNSV